MKAHPTQRIQETLRKMAAAHAAAMAASEEVMALLSAEFEAATAFVTRPGTPTVTAADRPPSLLVCRDELRTRSPPRTRPTAAPSLPPKLPSPPHARPPFFGVSLGFSALDVPSWLMPSLC